VCPDAEPSHEPFPPRLHEGFQRAPRGGHRIEIDKLAYGVELVEIEAVRVQPLQRAMELHRGSLARALDGLAAQEDLGANARHPGPEPQLRLPVARGHVDVIHAVLEGGGNGAIGHLLLHAPDAGSAEGDHAAHVSRAS